jgi:hypothetical protein
MGVSIWGARVFEGGQSGPESERGVGALGRQINRRIGAESMIRLTRWSGVGSKRSGLGRYIGHERRSRRLCPKQR